MPVDHEMLTASRILRELDKLTSLDAQRRVLRYLTDRLDQMAGVRENGQKQPEEFWKKSEAKG